MAGGLSVEGLCARLGGREVLRQITFTVDAPGWFGLLGVNGSGKTTLLRTLSGRLAPSAGAIRIAGADLTAVPELRAKAIGYAPPLHTLPARVTVRELLELVGRARGGAPRSPTDLYQALQLDRLEDRLIDTLSSGMRQRLALFLAFVGEPSVVLLDEPFNWLDPVGAYDAKLCLERLAQDCLIVTALHDVATFALRCRSGLLLQEGRVARIFDPGELEASRTDLPRLEQAIYDSLRLGGEF